MSDLPILSTKRLILRPVSLDDAPRIMQLAGEWEIAATTANIPHPYEEGMAEEWISTHTASFENKTGVNLAIVLRSEDAFIGAIGLHLNKQHQLAELGYWVGVPYWNQGYCTEAAKEMLRYGFEDLDINRIQARHMTKNPASGRVMEKIGMTPEGVLRQSLFRFDTFENAAIYSILRKEFLATK